MPPSGFGLRSAIHGPPVAVDHQLGELGDVVALDGLVVADVGECLGRRVEGEDARGPLPARPARLREREPSPVAAELLQQQDQVGVRRPGAGDLLEFVSPGSGRVRG